MKSREQIQKEAVDALIKHNGGTVCLSTGSGKTKVAIDYLMKVAKPYDTVVIAVPLNTLVETWIKEFQKWTQCVVHDSNGKLTVVVPNGYIDIVINTVQSLYKLNQTTTFLIIDEIHATGVTETYSQIFTNFTYKTVIGLTATLDVNRRPDKEELYEKFCPVVYEFHDGEEHGIVNKTKLVVINHTLDNKFRVKIRVKNKEFSKGEAEQYEYLSKQIINGQKLMAMEGSADFFNDASEWFWRKNGSREQMEAGRKYLGSITARRKFLLNLNSTAEIAKRLAKSIISVNDTNKVLVFSEQVDQLKKICKFNVYGEQSKDLNEQILTSFDDGEIRAVGSCYSLTLGVNLNNVTHAILESYQGSDTKATQRIGRMHRLDKDKIATIYVIRVNDTQSEKWFKSMLQEYDLSEVEEINSLEILK